MNERGYPHHHHQATDNKHNNATNNTHCPQTQGPLVMVRHYYYYQATPDTHTI